MKRLIFGMTLLMIAMAGQAQKKELSQARDNLKGNRNLPQTEQSMKNLLKDSATSAIRRFGFTCLMPYANNTSKEMRNCISSNNTIQPRL